jgi:hypothetical protein
MDMAGFFIKTHLLRGLSGGSGILSMMKDFKHSMKDHLHTQA